MLFGDGIPELIECENVRKGAIHNRHLVYCLLFGRVHKPRLFFYFFLVVVAGLIVVVVFLATLAAGLIVVVVFLAVLATGVVVVFLAVLATGAAAVVLDELVVLGTFAGAGAVISIFGAPDA